MNLNKSIKKCKVVCHYFSTSLLSNEQMVWISLILVSFLFVFYWLWPKNEQVIRDQNPKQYKLYETPSKSQTETSVEAVVYFEAGSSRLGKKENFTLKRLLTVESFHTLDSVLLIGSADTTGNMARNRKLVKERIRTIQNYLTSIGVSEEKISSVCLEPVRGMSAKERERVRSVQIKLTLLG
ncbi:OmpA-family protein [Leptospira biflexa serovar Patoc strain 'Patoc 1 (Ames)']|uniref:OmpA-like domain-containing protein n=2 Tax=Leptospira biflexa TaxID=172 RepID=B0SMS3_LEPBP|nr:OmpA-family protein [Leptospira biflexa serovar Patoc strain 'Patoc 1 (Ames)']ABZ98797.1 Hypothetical protein LEPBI_I2719 [Leptospira biflexa serovar Patoc strain 'Patoc 1 (Paris)']